MLVWWRPKDRSIPIGWELKGFSLLPEVALFVDVIIKLNINGHNKLSPSDQLPIYGCTKRSAASNPRFYRFVTHHTTDCAICHLPDSPLLMSDLGPSAYNKRDNSARNARCGSWQKRPRRYRPSGSCWRHDPGAPGPRRRLNRDLKTRHVIKIRTSTETMKTIRLFCSCKHFIPIQSVCRSICLFFVCLNLSRTLPLAWLTCLVVVYEHQTAPL